ncbi:MULTISPECIES: DNA-methyltransferase [Bacillus subtilis group]|uniref:Methyltransferase n=3 Tax=Bacillus subtilis group TaxID=653685 RepID=A0A7Z0WSX0_9BACI|nr:MULTISPECIES: site-specific DNA-methyltransferase [Bacillus subtilis group]ASB87709.1 Site-specific DNA-methyltransferase (adenine-specific) [Bacillus sonorensis]MDE1383302.1 site-specific DNA-methyltransferase [Bacillus paralicheniformis]MED4309188.1 site-specific DNA-methyltransferase [Bacillus paralicheniformis]MED4346924.1 site-specific DNA-methyltransferase [Bacillus paralicheniformis]OLF86363.1 Adenine-specific methyltransferase [Bacillus paralicheniformis]
MGKELLGSLELNRAYQMDCLEGMKLIPAGSVDMILCDLPYGTTACKWDTIIPFEPLWEQYERIIKDNGAIVLTASQPFTSQLVNSKIELFKYEWIWIKSIVGGAFDAKNKPMKKHENVLVFSKGGIPTNSKNKMRYFPQGLLEIDKTVKNNKTMRANYGGDRPGLKDSYKQTKTGYPNSLLEFKNDTGLHPTQKPVELFEYLIKTYTNEGDTVLDNCLGSGTTAVACELNNRKWIGFETEKEYIEIINKRLDQIQVEDDLSKYE